MWKAHSIAFDKMHGRDHWNEKLKYWEEGLGHSREIIDFIFDYHTKNNTDSLQWLLNLQADEALMPLSHYCDFDESKWR